MLMCYNRYKLFNLKETTMKKYLSLVALLLAIVMTLSACVTTPAPEESEPLDSSVQSESTNDESNESSNETSDISTTESLGETSDEEESSVEETTVFVHDATHARSIEEIKAELNVSDEDFSEAEALLEAFESAGLEEDAEYESVDAVYLEFEDKYNYIDTQVSLATIVYYYNMSDTEASELYLDVYGKFGDLYNAYIEVCKNLYKNSPVSAELFADWTEEDIEYLFDYDPRTQEIREEVEALQVELNELSGDVFTDRSAEIYAQIVTKNNELAKIEGYENYYEYASKIIYGRDYGTEELEAFSGYIATYFNDAVTDLYDKYSEAYKGMNKTAQNDLYKFENSSFGKLQRNYLDYYINSFGDSSTGAGFHHLFENRNFVMSSKYNSHPSAFQTYISGEGWDTPFCFFGSNGQSTMTVVHEMGHYYASLHNENVNSYDLAETQSQGNEMLFLAFVKPYMSAPVFRCVEASTMYQYVAMSIVCVIIDEFEREVYSLESVEGYGSKEFDAVMAKVCEKYGGVSYINGNITNINSYWRQVATNNPVYYISYATSMIAALNIYSVAKEDQAAAREIYRILVEESTEEDTLLTASAKAGLSSPFEEETIKAIIEGILGK